MVSRVAQAVLLRAGLHGRAESVFYSATSLQEDAHVAYRGLAMCATLQGRWSEAAGHWKNALFLATADDSEYLQRLGILLVLGGSVNEGRYYLVRAVTQWELSLGPSGNGLGDETEAPKRRKPGDEAW